MKHSLVKPLDRKTVSGRAAVLSAAVHVFAAYGYDGATVRDVARVARMSPANIYHYFDGKAALLAGVMFSVIDDLIDSVQGAIDGASANDPAAQVRSAVDTFIRFYIARRLECTVLDNERQHLDSTNAKRHVERRRELQRIFDEVVISGAEQRVFAPMDIVLASRTIMVVCRDVARWFDPHGVHSEEEVVTIYQSMVLSLLSPTHNPEEL
jgi:AcrR family transcriptional regulator